jgi:hypothetical protein
MPVFGGTPFEQIKAREAWDKARALSMLLTERAVKTPSGRWEAARKREKMRLGREFGSNSEEYTRLINKWYRENPRPQEEQTGLKLVSPPSENKEKES